MVLGLLFLTAIPTTIGVVEAVAESKKAAREAKLTQNCHLTVFCESNRQLHGGIVVLRPDGKVCISTTRSAADGFPFTGFYITYPTSTKRMGLVSMVSDDPPAMRWIYADKNTHELRFGNRSESIAHEVGPWDFTEEDELGVTLKGQEAFVAVEEDAGVWAVYFDESGRFEDLPYGKRIEEICLERHIIGGKG